MTDDLPTFGIAPSFEVKLAAPDAARGAIKGYAAAFGGEPDSHGDIIQPGAFTASLADHKAAGTLPLMLWSHNLSQPIGRWTDMGEDGRGLYAEGQLNLATSRGRDAHAHLTQGDVAHLSVGFQTPPGGRTRNRDGTSNLVKAHLVEASVVAAPSNPRARVTEVKSLASQRELEELLRDGGLSKAAAVKLARGGWPALSGRTDDPDPALQRLYARLDAAVLDLKSLKG